MAQTGDSPVCDSQSTGQKEQQIAGDFVARRRPELVRGLSFPSTGVFVGRRGVTSLLGLSTFRLTSLENLQGSEKRSHANTRCLFEPPIGSVTYGQKFFFWNYICD
ncbi:hypothetical protein CDAR_470941 [Caerostris darwini]|uniref:Uncharacterized protein n=1 Tax=Caerostris darwini TaxID=1538125 RepID=A0AAV4WAJ3_9ARAC|nr:hypothetical protein CDAR_470941 [Caerostris darwini]